MSDWAPQWRRPDRCFRRRAHCRAWSNRPAPRPRTRARQRPPQSARLRHWRWSILSSEGSSPIQVGQSRLAKSGWPHQARRYHRRAAKKDAGGRKPPPYRRNRSKIGLCASAEAGRARRAGPAGARAAGTTRADRLRLHRQQPLALQLLARKLAGAADRLRLFPRLFFRWFFVVAAEFHLAENALALHPFIQHLAGVIDIVVRDEILHACSFGCS